MQIELTPQELKIFDGIVGGLANVEIAHAVELSEKSVKAYVTKIMRKAQVDTRCRLIVAWYTGALFVFNREARTIGTNHHAR